MAVVGPIGVPIIECDKYFHDSSLWNESLVLENASMQKHTKPHIMS
jgi:hypothetical protein